MSSLLARIICEAKTAFERVNIENYSKELPILRQLINQLTLKDLNIDPEVMSVNTFSAFNKAPCTFIDIYENENFSLSVFILNGLCNYTMPLHDHPKMHGILRGIYGKLQIQSYTAVEEVKVDEITGRSIVFVKPEDMKEINENSECVLLSPKIANYHEITAIDKPAAFFDLLYPKYDGGPRKCNFYSKSKIPNENIFMLNQIYTPDSYYCDSIPYKLPDFCQ